MKPTDKLIVTETQMKEIIRGANADQKKLVEKSKSSTDKLIEEIIEKFPLMLKVHVPLECELTVRNVVTGEVFIGQKWRTESVLKKIMKKVAEAARAEERKLLVDGGWIMAPAAYRGTDDKRLLEYYAPVWEKNKEMLIEVCLCDKCPDSVLKLKDMAKDFRLALYCKDDNGEYVTVKALLSSNNNEA